MKKIILIIILILNASSILAQEIDYEHLRISKKNLNRMKFSNSVDIVFSSGVLLTGATATAMGAVICIETSNMEYFESDPEEYEGEPNPMPFLFMGAKAAGYGLGGLVAIGGLTLSTIGLNSLSKAITINRSLRKINFDVKDMSVNGKPGVGIGISIPLNN